MSQAIRSEFRNETAGVMSCVPHCLAIFTLASLGLESGWECEDPIVALHSLNSPQVGLKQA